MVDLMKGAGKKKIKLITKHCVCKTPKFSRLLAQKDADTYRKITFVDWKTGLTS